MDNKKSMDEDARDDTRKLTLVVIYMATFVLVLFGLVPSV